MKKILGLMASGAALCATPALAQEGTPSQVSLGVTGGTLGIGPELTWRASPLLSLRANATFLSVSHSVDGDDISYDGDIGLASGGVMVDLHPFKSGFRVSGGLRYSGNKVDLLGTPNPTEVVEVGGQSYTGAEIGTLSGKVEANDIAPSLTIGYASNATRGLKFGVELGAMFMGKPRINDLKATGPAAEYPEFQDAIDQEERDIEDDMDKVQVYPILQLSIGYAF